MNNRAQLAYLLISVVSGIIMFMAGMYLMNPLIDSVIDARTALACASASTITDGTKLLCLFVDSIVPYFILLVFSVAISLLVNKFLSSGGTITQ